MESVELTGRTRLARFRFRFRFRFRSGEVFEKQRNVDAVKEKAEVFNRGVWVGFTFGKQTNQVVASKLKGEGDVLETMF